jgi:hypothetical protein
VSDTTTTDTRRSRRSTKGSAKETGGLLAVAGVACVACCIGPIMAFLGGVTILGVASTTVIGIGGLFIAAMALGAALDLIRRRRASSCAGGAVPESVPVELTTRKVRASASR